MRSILFTVGRLEFVGSDKFMAAGRNCRDELRCGDRLIISKGYGGEGYEATVDEIIMYNRSVTEVEYGMTAGLFFSNGVAAQFCLGAELHAEIA